jgi:hypothetical protein
MNEQQKVKEAFNTLLDQIDSKCKRCGSAQVEQQHWDHEIKGGDSLVTFRLRVFTSVQTLNNLRSPYPVFYIENVCINHKKERIEISRNNDLIDFNQMNKEGVNLLQGYQSERFTKAMEGKYNQLN